MLGRQMTGAATNSFQFLTKGTNEFVRIDHALIAELVAGRILSREDSDVVDQFNVQLTVSPQAWTPFEWSPQEDNFFSIAPRDQWLDYLIYRYKMRVYPEKKIVSDFPVYVLVEPTSICNLRCTMCFQVDQSFTRKPFMGMMDIDLYKRVIDELVAGGTRALTLASRGEPTLHPKLGEMLRYAGGKFLDLKLNTNATRMTEQLCRDIIESGVTELVFSIDSHEKVIYEKIRVRGKFDEVLEGVMLFKAIRDSYGQIATHTRVSGVKFRPDQNTQGFLDFWSQHVDHVGYVDIEERWDTYNNVLHSDKTHPCNYLWERIYVWFDGIVNVCDVDYKSLLSTGNVKDSTIRDVWHGALYTKLREDHLNKQRALHSPCDRCNV